MQKGCQVVNGSTALNWIVSRNTEILVGEKIINEEGEDASSGDDESTEKNEEQTSKPTFWDLL